MIRTLAGRFQKSLCALMVAGCGLVHAGSYNDFFKAIEQDNPADIKALLTRGFDANTVDPKGQYGLLIAVGRGSLKAAQALTEWPQTDVNTLNANGESALMLAAIKGHTALAEALIKKDADINKTGWTPLHYAASASKLDIISLLLDNSAYIDAESPNGTTPLMMAAMYGTPAAVALLLKEGADPKLKNLQGLTALEFAQRGKQPDSVDAIAAFLRSKTPAGQW
jgi:ankyrin repeat protein